MSKVVLKRHWFKFYGGLLIGELVWFGGGTGMLFLFFHNIAEGIADVKTILMPFVSLLFHYAAFHTPRAYFRSAPKIVADEEKIIFNKKEVFYWKDISSIYLPGKKYFKYLLWSTPMDAAELYFKDATSLFIFDDFYANTWELKVFIQNVVVEKNTDWAIEAPQVEKHTFETDNSDTYKGNFFTWFRGLIFWVSIVFIPYILITNGQPEPIWYLIASFILAILATIFCGYLAHYFQVSNEYLIVRNHIFFWQKKVYRLSDLSALVIDDQYKMPIFLKFTTGDFRIHKYFAGSLRDKHWILLKNRLEENGIRVRNESVMENVPKMWPW